MAATFEPIASTTLGSDAASYTFSSIPQSFTDLVLVLFYTPATSGYGVGARFAPVGGSIDSGTNYSLTYLNGNGTSVASGRRSSQTKMWTAWSGTPTTYNAPTIFSIMSYSNTNVYKTALSEAAGPSTRVERSVSLWRNTAAIEQIELSPYSGNILAGSTFSLFGIKAAA